LCIAGILDLAARPLIGSWENAAVRVIQETAVQLAEQL
jgi:hypothetical protein